MFSNINTELQSVHDLSKNIFSIRHRQIEIGLISSQKNKNFLSEKYICIAIV